MIRFLIDQFRQAPGPLKQTRLLIADLSEEVLDLAKAYLKNNTSDEASPYSTEPDAESEAAPAIHSVSTPAAQTDNNTEQKTEPAPAQKTEPPAEATKNSDDKALKEQLKKALADPKNQRKQPFKIMAVLFDAQNSNAGPLLGKEVSEYGAEHLNIKISPENVRKVIRLKLGDYVSIKKHGNCVHAAYKYQLTDTGAKYFISTYLS
jgi:hypothetical protein